MVRRKQPDQARDVLVFQPSYQFCLLPEARQRERIVDKPIAHHLQRNLLAGEFVLRVIHDRHAAAADAPQDTESLDRFVAEPIARVLPQPIRHELGEDGAEFEVSRGQAIEDANRHEERADIRVGDDVRAACFTRDQRQFADQIVAREAPEQVIPITAAQQRVRFALQQDQQPVTGVALPDHGRRPAQIGALLPQRTTLSTRVGTRPPA